MTQLHNLTALYVLFDKYKLTTTKHHKDKQQMLLCVQ